MQAVSECMFILSELLIQSLNYLLFTCFMLDIKGLNVRFEETCLYSSYYIVKHIFISICVKLVNSL